MIMKVLLCALPTLLSMPTHNTLPTSFSFPISGSSAFPASSSAFDLNSVIPSEYDWSHNPSSTMMDLDIDDQGRITTKSTAATETHILQFVDSPSDTPGLGNLDISFDASPSEDGKIRVRIHSSPSESASSSAEHITKCVSRQRSSSSSSSSLSMWAGTQADSNFSDSSLSSFPIS